MSAQYKENTPYTLYGVRDCPICGHEPVLTVKEYVSDNGHTEHHYTLSCPHCHCVSVDNDTIFEWGCRTETAAVNKLMGDWDTKCDCITAHIVKNRNYKCKVRKSKSKK